MPPDGGRHTAASLTVTIRSDDGETSKQVATFRDRLTPRRLTIAGCIVWSVVVAAMTLPSALGGVGSWLDGSWQVALSLSHRLGLPMGSRLLFPYGPYGYLTVAVPFFTAQWLEAVIAGLVIHGALVALVTLLLAQRRAGPVVWVAVTAALLIGLPAFAAPDTEGQLVAILLAFFAVETELPRWRTASAALCGVTLALLLLMKATALPLAAGVLILGIGGLLLRRRGRAALALTAAFVIAGAVLWFAAGLGVRDVTHYLHAALEFGSGYSGAMYFMGLTAGIVLGGAIIVVLAVLGTALLARRRQADGLWLLLVCVALFPVFKDSFVRDGPIRDDIFFGVAGLLAALSLVVVAPSARAWWSRRQLAPVLLLVACLALGMAWRATDLSGITGAASRLAGYRTTAHAVLSSSLRRDLESSILRSAQAYYAGTISALPALPAGSTIDVMPWDIGIFYEQASLHWDPRPVLQSYQAYTPWLDQQDADFLRSATAPDFIIYSYLTVDDRYAAFDEPATFRALLENYRVAKVLGPQVVLLQRVAATSPSESVESTSCAPLGTAIDVPQHAGVRTFAHVDMKRTLVGSALNLLAKSPEARVTLTTAAGSFDRRLVQAVAGDGLYVTSFLSATPDIDAAMAAAGGVPITSLSVSGDATAWSSRYCVTFATTPLSGQQTP
jgi:hypothetical protein